jgi:predicted secreted acid phosphatase
MKRRSRVRLFAAILLWIAATRAQTATVAREQPCKPVNLGLYKIELTKDQKSGRYERDLAAVASRAMSYLARPRKDRGKPAVVFDIDETALSNWPVIKRDDFGVILNGPCDLAGGPCGWNAWIAMARDKPIVSTLNLYRQARRQKMAVFFITGRHEVLRKATERNLRDAGYDGWTDLLMVPDGFEPTSIVEFKAPARKRIVEQGYSIVLNMGDQESDLKGGWAEKTFKLPDPFYYIP